METEGFLYLLIDYLDWIVVSFLAVDWCFRSACLILKRIEWVKFFNHTCSA